MLAREVQKNMKKIFFIIITISIIGIAYWLVFVIQPSPTLEKPEEIAIGEIEKLESPNLPELFYKEFNGHNLQLGEVLADNDIYTRYYITYQSDDLKISGIMNVPIGTGPFPVLILNHGYIDPEIYTNGRGLKREQDYLARQGYVVIHPDYRNHAQSDKVENVEENFRLGYTEDVINLILAVKNSGFNFLDKDKIGMLGHSMGGGITENVLVIKPSLVKAAVLFAPVSADVRDNFNKWTRSRVEVAAKILNDHGSFDDNPDFWDNLSPINFIDRIITPIAIHHGTIDESVPVAWSEKFHQALKENNKESFLYFYENEPHEFIDAWPEVMSKTADFFDQYLKK